MMLRIDSFGTRSEGLTHKEDEILALIRIVDSGFSQWKAWGFWLGFFPWALMMVLIVLLGILIATSPIPTSYYFIGLTAPILVLFLGYSNFVLSRREENLVNSNYNRIVKQQVNMVLYALVLMKVKHPKIELEEVYNADRKLFDRTALIERIYSK